MYQVCIFTIICSHMNLSLQCSPWSQDTLQYLWSGRLPQDSCMRHDTRDISYNTCYHRYRPAPMIVLYLCPWADLKGVGRYHTYLVLKKRPKICGTYGDDGRRWDLHGSSQWPHNNYRIIITMVYNSSTSGSNYKLCSMIYQYLVFISYVHILHLILV